MNIDDLSRSFCIFEDSRHLTVAVLAAVNACAVVLKTVAGTIAVALTLVSPARARNVLASLTTRPADAWVVHMH